MSTGQCRRLLAAYRHAQTRPVRVIVLGPPRDFFGNGIHLNVIQAAADPAAESWRNINAIDDLVHAILTNTGQVTVAALAGNAAAGGLMLALAADQVWCRSGAVLNPHYRLMGLHGSEYWTYTLPRRVGAAEAARLTQACLPVTPASALRSGLVDRAIPGDPAAFRTQVTALAEDLAGGPAYPALLTAKTRQLAAPGQHRPLAAYRAAELAVMARNFFDPGEPYAGLRRAFVYKEKPSRTPPHLGRHRTYPAASVSPAAQPPWAPPPPPPAPRPAGSGTALARPRQQPQEGTAPGRAERAGRRDAGPPPPPPPPRHCSSSQPAARCPAGSSTAPKPASRSCSRQCKPCWPG